MTTKWILFHSSFFRGEKNHTGSTTPSQKENAMKMIYFFFLIKWDHVLNLNKSMEEKTSTRLSLFTVTESPYLLHFANRFYRPYLIRLSQLLRAFLQNFLQSLLPGDVKKTTSAFLKVRRLVTVLLFSVNTVPYR